MTQGQLRLLTSSQIERMIRDHLYSQTITPGQSRMWVTPIKSLGIRPDQLVCVVPSTTTNDVLRIYTQNASNIGDSSRDFLPTEVATLHQAVDERCPGVRAYGGFGTLHVGATPEYPLQMLRLICYRILLGIPDE